MSTHRFRRLSSAMFLALSATIGLAQETTASTSPHLVSLRCDAMAEPLGIDDPNPQFSWQLDDETAGARQTAYRVRVFAQQAAGTPALWDSGQVHSSVSSGVVYAGPKLMPSTRYFWQVDTWDKDDKPYPTSQRTWWETGLLQQANWTSKWVGYESAELHSLRSAKAQWITTPAAAAPAGTDSHHAFRARFTVAEASAPPCCIQPAEIPQPPGSTVGGYSTLIRYRHGNRCRG